MSRTHVYAIDGVSRTCACGNYISMTDKIRDFGLKHGKDLTVWPAKCMSCILDAAVALFDSVDLEPMPAPGRKCVKCGDKVGGEIDYYQDTPGIGDLCMTCWKSRDSK